MSLSTLMRNKLSSLGNYSLVSVIGSQWGDEGKGKIVDSIAPFFDIVTRFNGGANAGHTLYIKDKKYVLHMLPCGIFHRNVTNVIGNGVVIDYGVLKEEIDFVKKENLYHEKSLLLSNRAHIIFKFHKILDNLLETSLGNKKIGTTARGIGPCHALKSARLGLRLGDLAFDFSLFTEKYKFLLQFLQSIKKFDYNEKEELENLYLFRKEIKDQVVDTSLFICDEIKKGKKVLAEGANATMLDLNFGSYPFVTSSNTTSSGVYNGLGIPPTTNSCSIGVVKAYTTRVGFGPFPTEIDSEIGESISRIGSEFGATTHRKRRVGWIDIPLLKYSNMLNGCKSYNLTKLDILSHLDEIKIGIEYRLGKSPTCIKEFPSTLEELKNVNVVYETMPGWKSDISTAKQFSDLPTNAQKYIIRLEELLEVPINWVGVGQERNSFVLR